MSPSPSALQPLARLDDAGERAWAAEWVAALLAREAVTVTPELKEHLWSALTSLASAPRPGADDHGPLGSPAVQRAEAGLAALHRRRTLGTVARRRDRTPRRGRRPGLRDRGPDRRQRRARGSLLSLPPHRRSARRASNPAHHRRRLARPRRPRLRRTASRMAEDAAQEECERHLRHPVARRHRRLGNRAGDHRELPDPAVSAE